MGGNAPNTAVLAENLIRPLGALSQGVNRSGTLSVNGRRDWSALRYAVIVWRKRPSVAGRERRSKPHTRVDVLTNVRLDDRDGQAACLR